MLVLSIVLQLYLKASEEILYFYQEVKWKLIKFQGYLSKWIILRQTMKKIRNIFISLRLSEKKCIREISTFFYGLYYTYINTIEMHVMVN